MKGGRKWTTTAGMLEKGNAKSADGINNLVMHFRLKATKNVEIRIHPTVVATSFQTPTYEALFWLISETGVL